MSRKLAVCVAVILFFGITNVLAGSLTAKILTSSYLTDDNVLSRGTAIGIELSYMISDDGYVFISNEVVRMQPIYKDFYYDITGIGVGGKILLTKRITVFSQAGYYLINNSIGDRAEGDNEALRYFLNGRFSDATGLDAKFFDDYGVENDNAFGITIGLDFYFPLTKNFDLISSISYRVMKFDQTIKGFRHEWDSTPNSWWEAGSVQDFSSLNMGVGINFKF